MHAFCRLVESGDLFGKRQVGGSIDGMLPLCVSSVDLKKLNRGLPSLNVQIGLKFYHGMLALSRRQLN
tara:strand:+ start:1714 stop:1917 length:204 start_codon:yes stop_codon:yes gene_type:complete